MPLGRPADTGTGVANATVKSAVLTATTDAQGRYSLQLPSSERAVLNVSAAGYAETLSVTALPENGTAALATRLLPVGGTTSISTATGGTATVANSTASVIFPPDAFATSDTRVTVELTPVNPARDPALMPGDYTTNTGGLLESGGAIIVTPRDSAGNVVQLAAGKTATIRIPLSTRGTPEPTMPLWFLDKATGRWMEEGVATLTGAAPNQYYEGTVTHFSTWNADVLYTSINVLGCVQDAQGTRVADVRVTSDGIDYTGAAYSLTNANGVFTVPMKSGGRAIISGAQGIGVLTNSESVGPSDTDISRLQNCLVLTPASNVVTMKLTWGAAPEDVDSYLYTPSGYRVFYNDQGSLASAPFANLDVDDLVSFGPEVVTTR